MDHDTLEAMRLLAKVAQEREARLRPVAEKLIEHWQRGLTTLDELVQALYELTIR